jgi:steroid 5-alpha reductase family enzyme
MDFPPIPEFSSLPWYLIGVGAVFALFTLVWLGSIPRRDVSIIDIWWGPGFVLASLLFLAGGTYGGNHTLNGPRPPYSPFLFVYFGLIALWGLRLAGHIASRHQGEDYRYRAMREKAGPRFVWTSLFRVFFLQAALVAAICPPLLFILTQRRHAPAWWSDWVALALFAVGFFFEAVGDWQLQRFKKDPGSKGKVMRSGLWKYSRHPNYFGEAVIWVSFYFAALGSEGGWLTLPSVLLMIFLLLKVSGVALLEKTIAKRRPEYEDYIATTPAFFPWFPKKRSGAAR